LASVSIDTSWNGQLSIARGGTGQGTKAPAFNALSPLGTTGDLLIYTGGSNAALGIGSSGQVLTVSGGVPTWATPSSGPTASSSQIGFGGSSADYTVTDSYDLIEFGSTPMEIGVTGAGTWLVQVELSLYTDTSHNIYVKLDGVSGSERYTAIQGGYNVLIPFSALVTSSGTTTYQAYIKKTALGGNVSVLKSQSIIRYIKLA